MTTTAGVVSNSNTLSALRNPNFRLYFAGQLVSTAGTWMQNIAQGFLVFQITKQNIWLGIVACAAGLPLVLLSPISGVVVERIPRRRLMIVTQTVQMLLAFILAGLVFAQIVQPWHIVVLALFLGITNAFDQPARQTFVVEMVGREDLHSGITLNSMLNSGSRMLGPAAAGVALHLVGAGWCFLLNGLSFLAVIASLLIMHVPFAIQRVRKSAPLQELKEGLNYARRDEMIAPLLLLTATVGLFSLPILQLFAAFASNALHSPDDGLSALSAAQGIGSVLAGVVITWLVLRLGRGRVIALMTGLSAVAVILLSRQTSVGWAALFSAFSGLFVVSQVVSINTLVQSTVPDEFRGRVMALYSLAFFGLIPFSALAFGALGDAIHSTANAILIAGIAGIVVSTLILLRWPHIIRQR